MSALERDSHDEFPYGVNVIIALPPYDPHFESRFGIVYSGHLLKGDWPTAELAIAVLKLIEEGMLTIRPDGSVNVPEGMGT